MGRGKGAASSTSWSQQDLELQDKEGTRGSGAQGRVSTSNGAVVLVDEVPGLAQQLLSGRRSLGGPSLQFPGNTREPRQRLGVQGPVLGRVEENQGQDQIRAGGGVEGYGARAWSAKSLGPQEGWGLGLLAKTLANSRRLGWVSSLIMNKVPPACPSAPPVPPWRRASAL